MSTQLPEPPEPPESPEHPEQPPEPVLATASADPAGSAEVVEPAQTPVSGRQTLSSRLYRGQLSFEFIRLRRRWYIFSAVLLVIAALGVGFRGLNFSVDFTGGNTFQVAVPARSTASVTTVTDAVTGLGVSGADQPVVTLLTGGTEQIRVQTGQTSDAAVTRIQQAVATSVGAPVSAVSVQSVGSSWGKSITRKAILSLVVFLVLVMVYLALAFEWQMGLAAIISLLHDLAITVGVYALVGFQVSPATVIGVLTILGYSLYDTVVVFDKVRENTRSLTSGSQYTYSEAANLALNQTLVRSLNTTLIALLPVLSILVIGSAVLGPGVLEDLALALAIGMAVGAYSSIFIATPLLSQLREREPAMQALARRVATARSTDPAPVPAVAVPAVVVGTAGATALPRRPTAAGQAPRRPGTAGRPPRRPGAGRPPGGTGNGGTST